MNDLPLINQQLSQIPIIDIHPLVPGIGDKHAVADKIGQACRDHGFFYIVGHAIEESLQQHLKIICR